MKNKNKTFHITMLSMMLALTIILVFTPLGTIPVGAVSITIAHIPILIVTLLFGLKDGLVIALSFGLLSMFKAMVAPQSALDPLFINPLISILPRLMIPITTHYIYKLVTRWNDKIAIALAVAIGNLTNTFFVYLSMYIFVKSQAEMIMGKSLAIVILGMVSSVTIFKTIGVLIITVPIVLGLKKYLKSNQY